LTPQIILVLSILLVAIVFLVTEWIPMEVTALLVLGSTALTGLVSPTEALSGFSSPAVVTVWAVFILSGALNRTGVAKIIGHRVLRLAGRGEALMVVVIMVSSGVMSAAMNNVAVAALMLPVVMDITRQTGHPPSRLLMPLAYGTLLGGLTTLIGTPPNILVSSALRDNGLTPFKLFDYTPVGLVVMTAGIAFVALIGRHLLPVRNLAKESPGPAYGDFRESYALQERIFYMRVPPKSGLVNKTLRESRLGAALGLNVVGIHRAGQRLLAPDPSLVICAGDRLIVEGRLEKLEELGNWRQLLVEKDTVGIERLFSKDLDVAEISVSRDSVFIGKTLYDMDFRNRFGVHVLSILRDNRALRTNLRYIPLKAGDTLLLYGLHERPAALKDVSGFEHYTSVPRSRLTDLYHLNERLLEMRVPDGSSLTGKTLKKSRLGDALGMRVLCINRKNGTLLLPESEEILLGEDRLIVQGRLEDLSVLKGLEELEIEQKTLPDMKELESETVGILEAVLSPHTTLAGKTLRELHFREKYGLSVLAIWREGRAYRSDLRDMPLRFGDALLLFGLRGKLQLLGREPDFIVLTEAAQEIPHMEKAKTSVLIMACVLLPVMLGWVPIYIAAVVGAAFTVLTRCLTMEEAYRSIEWKAIFLIAGMLPLGTALDHTGAARFLSEGVVTAVGPLGPLAVMTALVVLTFLATCIIPTAALVVLMAPIVLKASASMGISSYPFMMAMAMAASSSFMTPVSHPANVLVMGPGGYRFADYLKVGAPLTLLVLIVIVIVVPYFWPLFP
jgi:di/tricarboxylate transporter